MAPKKKNKGGASAQQQNQPVLQEDGTHVLAEATGSPAQTSESTEQVS